MADLLPPVIVRIIGTDKDLLSSLAEAKTALEDFAKNDYRVKLTATLGALLASVEKVTREADAYAAAHPIEMQATLPGLSPLAAKLIAETAALQATADAHPIEIPISTSGGFLSGLGGGLSAGLGGLLGSILPMLFKSGGGGGILGAIPGLGGIAGALPGGLIPAAAGLGTESLVIGPLMGLVGSMVGAIVGAGFLGLGAGGVGAVGFGTNAAGIGQGIADIQKYRTALAQLNTAIATYGPTSTAATQAQKHLNFVLSQMPQVAQGPIVALSNTVTAMATLWDKATGPAEAKGLHILTELAHVVERFFTTIGKFSSQNMSILTKGIKPLFNWLGTTGLKIFTNLENVFQKNMPKGITAMVNGLELLFKIITDVSPSLGHFVTMIAHFLKKLNTSTQGKLKAFINTMIGDFDAWFGFVKQLAGLGKTVLPLVAHLGTMMVNTIFTPIVKGIRSFVQQNAGVLKQFFTNHKNLMGGIGTVIKNLMPIVGQLILGFIGLANALRPLTTAGLKQVASLIKDLDTVFMIIADFLSGNIAAGAAQSVRFGGHIAKQVTAGAGHAPRLGTAGNPLTALKNVYTLVTKAIGKVGHYLNPLNWFGSSSAGAAEKVGKTAATHIATGLASSHLAKTAASRLAADLRSALEANLKAKTIAKRFDQNFGGTLLSSAGVVKSDAGKLGTDVHDAVLKHLLAKTIADTFAKHLGVEFLAHATSLSTTARELGTDVHDAVLASLHADELGKTLDERFAESINANRGLVIAEAKKLGADAAAAFASAGTGASSAFITRLKSGTVMR